VADPSPELDSKKRFSNRVEYYVKSRPRYPNAVLEFCQAELSLQPADPIADIGSGTGFLTELFLQNGNTVFAVEPNDPMRQAAEKKLAHLQNFLSVNGTAEQTGLPAGSIGFVVAGQAFHWFDRVKARIEFQRILRPGGHVVLVWNEHNTDPSTGGFTAAYDAVVNEFATDRQKVRREGVTADDSKAITDFFAPAVHKIKKFDNPQTLDLEGVLARALSSSYLPLPGQPRCDEMLDRLREIFRLTSKNGVVVQQYVTKVYYGPLT
jgi:ubiquinone/menaquinone biosynthesis C-methylase UbiE